MSSGYIQKFVPPNKLVIAQWDDSARGKVLSQQYGNQTETITMLGLASTPSTPALDEFMNALLNVKSCHTLMTEADALSQGGHPLSEPLQKGMLAGYSTELDVVVNYPNETDTDTGPQFFNAKGELSADILIDMTRGVCDRPDASIGAAVVTIGDLLLGKGDKSDFEPVLATPANKFISLNAYLLANELQPGEDMHGDPRPASQFYYGAKSKPLPDAVAEVLKIGAPNQGPDSIGPIDKDGGK
jgi:hypothetical protein